MEEAEDGIAVIGIGCNFPGGEGLDNFWKVLVNGKNCSVPIPGERFDLASWYDLDDSKAGKSRTAKAALIDGFNEFDHRFFGISDSEVEQMDPQQKQLLQCVYRALENAGIPMERASGTRTGVFFGIMNRDYETSAAQVHPSVISHWTGTGLAMSIAANRVSYVFNFTGPSLSIDCACSSSLVALHLACQSIRQDDCVMAVCGGVNYILEPRVFVSLSEAKMISPEGTSKPFSNRADGYGRGEGCGVVLLKPLKQAIKDNDHIWGIISKTAVNQDGHSVTPITKPSKNQQEELLHRIYSKSDLANVQYIEAHGTGTPVGDPTEAESISSVIAKARPAGSPMLQIGSVKGNIGHTESAAGVAGLIKVLLMMKHKTIVPSVFYSDQTASVDAKALNIEIPQKVDKWEASGERIAGVNNFGFGGTNAHAIVKQCKQSGTMHMDMQNNHGKQPKYFVLSANSQKSLTLMVEDTIRQLELGDEVNLDALLYTSACRRTHQKHRYRKAFMVSSVVDLRDKLNATVGKNITMSYTDSRLVFVFCGNGVSYHGMCKQLLKREPVFRDKIAEIAQLYKKLTTLNILDRLESELESSDFQSPDVAQPLLFAIQVGIYTLLRHWGIQPNAVLGHSVGEVAAAHCSGLLSLEDAVKVIHFRSTLQSKVTGGSMLVISNMAESEVAALLPCYSGTICFAAFNSPQSCTLSGDADAIEDLHKELSTSVNGQNLFLCVLDVPAAYHSHMMDPILPEIKQKICSLQANNLNTELFSTVTGKEVQQGDFCTGEYWARNIREPVAFEQAVKSATKGKRNTVFVEIGPRRALQRNIVETLGKDTAVLASVQPEKDHETMTSVVSALFELGVSVNWSTLYKGHETLPLPFPKYQFDCSARDAINAARQLSTASNHPVLCKTGSDGNVFSCDLKSDCAFYLREHKHNGIPIIPGAFYAELGLAAFLATAKPKVPLNSLQLSVTFHSPFVFTRSSPEMKVRLEQTETRETSFTVFSPSVTYASGTVVSKKERLIEERNISIHSIYKRCKSVVSAQEFYWYLSQGGFQYGDVFQNKGSVHYGQDLKEAFSVVTVPEELHSQLHDYCIHPVMLDFLMQLLPVTVEHIFAGRPGFPAKIGSLSVFEPLQTEMIIYLRATDVGLDHFEVCGCFADKEGRVLVEVKHVIIKYLGSRSDVVEEYFYHNSFAVIPENITSAPPPKALIFSDHTGISKGLQQYLDSRSQYVSFTYTGAILSHGFPSLLESLNILDIERNFDEVLFLWGQENITSLEADTVLQNLADCCEIFRQIVLELKQIRFPKSIRAVTYCSSEMTVDHISPGFALVGLTRSFAAEIPDLQFQLIDMSSGSAKDIAALSEILRSCPCSQYPELVVKDGLIFKPSIVHTPPGTTEGDSFTVAASKHHILQTADAHKMTQLSAVNFEEEFQTLSDGLVEIQPTNICVHSSDYFPVSASHLKYGQTLYWNQYSSQNHKLLALDFSGTITAVGKNVKKLRVGDHVAACYPVVAAGKVIVPEDVCYRTKHFPFLPKTPCISYFVLAWEILHRVLPRSKRNLGIISSVADSTLAKVLALTLKKSGWNVIVRTHQNGFFDKGMNEIDAFVILPPIDESLICKACNFSGVKHVVVICETQVHFSLAEDALETVRESVCVQTIQMQNILQKGLLSAESPHIYCWLKSMCLNRKLSFESFTFQSGKTENVNSVISKKQQSYFSSKRLAVVALENDAGGAVSDIPLLPTKKQLFLRRAVYIVTGGLSGLGFETVKFISQRGGGYVVILSRSQPTPEVQKDIHDVEAMCGNSITAMACDISVSQSVQKAFSVISQNFPSCPIRGVFHSAVVLHDGLIETLNRSLYEKVLKPKVNGSLNLHNATQHCQLDYFVCYSSISAFLGNASQTNYAAANTFLDMLCHYRRKLGLSGQSINWGALNVGLLSNKDHLLRFLEAKGIMVLNMAEVHKSLEQCLLLNLPQQAVCRFHFKNIRYNILSQNAALTMRLSALVYEAFQKETKQKETDIETQPTELVSPKEYVLSLLSEITGMDKSELTDESALSSLGVDSMQAMTLQNFIYQERGLNVPLVKLLDPNATVATVVMLLSNEEGGEDEHLSEDSDPLLTGDTNHVSTRL